MEATWRSIADTFAEAFPKSQIAAVIIPRGMPPLDNVGNVMSDPAGDRYFTDHIIQQGIASYGAQFVVQNSGLSTAWIAPGVSSVAGQVTTGYQTVWNVTNDTTWRVNGGVGPYNPAQVLREVVNDAVAAGASFLELYQVDILNPVLQDVIADAHDALTS